MFLEIAYLFDLSVCKNSPLPLALQSNFVDNNNYYSIEQIPYIKYLETYHDTNN